MLNTKPIPTPSTPLLRPLSAGPTGRRKSMAVESISEQVIPNRRLPNSEALQDYYTIVRKLGQGSFGTVCLVKEKSSNAQYACKSIKKVVGSPSAYEQMQREITIMKQVKHEHIVQLKEVFETNKTLFLVMEYCPGDFSQRIQNIQNEHIVRMIIRRLADVVAYLHSMGIVHRDIKPENILLSTSKTDKYYIKLADFGLATFTNSCTMMENIVGTPLYMAPEIVKNMGYSSQCDIWSIGVMMYLIQAETLLRKMINECKIDYPDIYWANVSPGARALVDSMLRFNPAQRITAGEILMHPWIKGEEMGEGMFNHTVLDLMRSYNAERRLNKVLNVVRAAVRWILLIKHKKRFGPQVTLAKSSASNSVSTMDSSHSNSPATLKKSKDELKNVISALADRLEQHHHRPSPSAKSPNMGRMSQTEAPKQGFAIRKSLSSSSTNVSAMLQSTPKPENSAMRRGSVATASFHSSTPPALQMRRESLKNGKISLSANTSTRKQVETSESEKPRSSITGPGTHSAPTVKRPESAHRHSTSKPPLLGGSQLATPTLSPPISTSSSSPGLKPRHSTTSVPPTKSKS